MAVSVADSMTASEAVKVDHLCNRILGDIGSVHRRAFTGAPLPAELLTMRLYVRETQDAVRDKYPEAFFK